MRSAHVERYVSLRRLVSLAPRSGERVGVRGLQRQQDRFKHRVGFHQNVVVPESQNTEALRVEQSTSHLVRAGLVQVTSPIDLDDQPPSTQTKSTMYGPMRCWRRNLNPGSP